jgi:dihydropyrimidinase
MKRILITNGLVVSEETESRADILIEGEKIKRIGKNPGAAPAADRGTLSSDRGIRSGCEIIDAAGKIVIPGGVDVHTHLNLDAGLAVASDDFYTGTIAAAWGGTTTIVDHPAFGPPLCPLDHQIKKYHGLAEGRAVIDYGFHGVIQHVNDDVLQDMETLSGEGVTSYKIYLTYGFKLSDSDCYRVLKKAKDLGLTIAVHPENDGLVTFLREQFAARGETSPAYHPLSRPAECEAEAVNRMILLAKMAGDAPLYIVHLTNALGLEFITAARRRGQKNIWAETCPQYLFLDESLYSLPGAEGLKYLMCPPLRTRPDQQALWNALAREGTPAIDVVATDHCPFFFETQKMKGKDDFTKCPSGVPGIEERIPLMYSEGVVKGRISLRRFVDLCCANPAKRFGLYPRKGVIKEGSDADIVIIDGEKKVTIRKAALHENTDYTAYEGFKVQGWPECTISRGEVIVRGGNCTAAAGRGKFIKRALPGRQLI